MVGRLRALWHELRYEHRAAASLSGCGIVIMCTPRRGADRLTRMEYTFIPADAQGQEAGIGWTFLDPDMLVFLDQQTDPATAVSVLQRESGAVAQHVSPEYNAVASAVRSAVLMAETEENEAA